MSLPRNNTLSIRPISDCMRERVSSDIKFHPASKQSRRSASDPTHFTTDPVTDRRYKWALEMLEADLKLAPFVDKVLNFLHSFETRDPKNLHALDNLIGEGREITWTMEDIRKTGSRSDRTEEQLDEMVKVLQQMTMVDDQDQEGTIG